MRCRNDKNLQRFNYPLMRMHILELNLNDTTMRDNKLMLFTRDTNKNARLLQRHSRASASLLIERFVSLFSNS